VFVKTAKGKVEKRLFKSPNPGMLRLGEAVVLGDLSLLFLVATIPSAGKEADKGDTNRIGLRLGVVNLRV
jgi:hypothetical protein